MWVTLGNPRIFLRPSETTADLVRQFLLLAIGENETLQFWLRLCFLFFFFSCDCFKHLPIYPFIFFKPSFVPDQAKGGEEMYSVINLNRCLSSILPHLTTFSFSISNLHDKKCYFHSRMDSQFLKFRTDCFHFSWLIQDLHFGQREPSDLERD